MIEIARMPPTPDFAPGSDNLLPARMAPLPDELLSSWLVRLAMAHGMKLHSFCVEVFGRKAQIWNRDIDKLADERILRVISERTGVGYKRVFQTTLADYAGKIYETHNPNGNTVWIMPIGVYHRKRLRYGLQFCPYCLREDAEPYYRRKWRLSWIVSCDRHGVLLRDRCPGCANPIVFFRNEMGRKSQPLGYSMIECSNCEMNWTTQRRLSKCIEANRAAMDFQNVIESVVTDGWGKIPGFGYVHSIPYFKGLKQLLRVLSVCNRSATFRSEMVKRSGIAIDIFNIEMNFDYLPVEKRQNVVQAAARLIDDWAIEFIAVAELSKTWSSTLLAQVDDSPFWYRAVVKKSLFREIRTGRKQE
jgi:TniQ